MKSLIKEFNVNEVQITTNNTESFLHEIYGDFSRGTEITLTVPPDWLDDDNRVILTADASLLKTNLSGNINAFGTLRKLRNGIDEYFYVDVFLPHMWAKRELKSKQPLRYVSRRGWFSSAIYLIKQLLLRSKKNCQYINKSYLKSKQRG